MLYTGLQSSRGDRDKFKIVGVVLLASLSLAAVVAFLWLVVYPGYKSTSSRLYPTSYGYPALLRLMGRPVPVEVAKAKPARLSQAMMGQGFLSPHRLFNISTRSPNRISRVLVDVGDAVHRGQLLIELDPTYARDSVKMAEASLRIAKINLAKLKAGSRPGVVREKDASLRKAKGDLKTAQAQLARESRLFDQGAIPRQELEEYQAKYRTSLEANTIAMENAQMAKHSTGADIRQAEAKVESARADLLARLKDLEETKIYAPTDGVVISRDIEPGEVTRGAGQRLLVIAHGLEFQVQLDQQYFGKVHIGQSAEVFLEARPDQTFYGEVIRFNPSVQGAMERPGLPDRQAPTFTAWVKLKNLQPGVSLAPGMQGYARLIAHHKALAVPTGAIINFSGGEGLVLVVKDSRIAVRPVRFGPTTNSMTEIDNGLAEGDVVVVSGQEALKPGDRVTVEDEKSN